MLRVWCAAHLTFSFLSSATEIHLRRWHSGRAGGSRPSAISLLQSTRAGKLALTALFLHSASGMLEKRRRAFWRRSYKSADAFKSQMLAAHSGDESEAWKDLVSLDGIGATLLNQSFSSSTSPQRRSRGWSSAVSHTATTEEIKRDTAVAGKTVVFTVPWKSLRVMRPRQRPSGLAQRYQALYQKRPTSWLPGPVLVQS